MLADRPTHDRQLDEARRRAAVKYPLRGLAVVRRAGKEDVVHIGLWVAVVEREPARLNLHHEPVSRQEHVIHVRQCEPIALHYPGGDGTWFRETVPVAPA